MREIDIEWASDRAMGGPKKEQKMDKRASGSVGHENPAIYGQSDGTSGLI